MSRYRFVAGLMAFCYVMLSCTTVPALPWGDYNDDGTVDAADYIAYRANVWTENFLPNDRTPHWVMPDDYDVWREYFGQTDDGGSAAVSSNNGGVPEPSSVLVLLVGMLFMSLGRWSR